MGKKVVDIEIVQGVFERLMRQNFKMDCTWDRRGKREREKDRGRERQRQGESLS